MKPITAYQADDDVVFTTKEEACKEDFKKKLHAILSPAACKRNREFNETDSLAVLDVAHEVWNLLNDYADSLRH